MRLDAIAHIVQAGRVRQMRVQKRHDMRPRRKGSGFFIDPVLLRKFRDQIGRDQLANLTQNR